VTVSFAVHTYNEADALRRLVLSSLPFAGSPTAVLATLTGRANDRGVELADLTVTRQTLEDAYLELVGEAEQSPA
jgi:hypothetical protein